MWTHLMLCVALMSCIATAATPTPETPVFQTTQTVWTDRALIPIATLAPYETDKILVGYNEPDPAFMNFLLTNPGTYSVRCTIGLQTCSVTIFAAAQRSGYGPSAVVNYAVTINVNLDVFPPTFSPATSNFTGGAVITLTSTSTAEGAVTRYVIDSATPPNITSPIYTAPIIVSASGTHTIQAIDTVTTLNSLTNVSSVVSKTFNVEWIAPIQPPTVSKPSGTYAPSVTATASCPDAAAVPYASTDGVTYLAWTTEVTFSSGTVSLNSISEQTFNIQVVCRVTGLADSAITSITYIVRTHAIPAVPVISPTAGAYTEAALSVTITCPTAGCAIFYTTDSSVPEVTFTAQGGINAVSPTTTFSYKGGVSVGPGITQVSAISVSGGWYSPTVFSRYDVTGILSPPQFNPPPDTEAKTEVNVTVTSEQSANVWYIVRADGNSKPIPTLTTPSEWQMLPTGTSNIPLLESSTVHIQLDKQNYAPPPLASARYIITHPTVTTFAQANSPNLLWLLLLLLLVPIAAIIIATVIYVRRERRKRIEKETFAQLGFIISDE